MVFPDSRVYICKYCGRKLEQAPNSNTARLINHLYENHPAEIDQLKDLYLRDVVREAYELKGAAK